MLKRILLIDDSLPIHALLRTHLQDEPFEVRSACDGISGLRFAAEFRPDLILLDVDMPNMNGFEVCRRLKEDPITMNIPVIFLTAAAASGEKVNGLELGANDYITKPFDPAELVARIHASLRIKSRMDSLASARVKEFVRGPLREAGVLRNRG